MKRLICAVNTVLWLAYSPAYADTAIYHSTQGAFIMAPMLLSACKDTDPSAHCDPYIAGVMDSIVSNRGVFENNHICTPPDVDIAKLRSIVVKFIEAHGEFPQDSIAASEVATAITEAYPCK